MVASELAQTNESSRLGRRIVRPTAATVALGIFFLAVTKGPVFWVRRELGAVTVDFIDDPWVQLVFVASALSVVALSWPSRRHLVKDPVVTMAFTLLITVILLSALWSVSRSRTLEQGLMLALCTLAGLLAGAYLDRVWCLVALWSAMQAGVVASVYAWRHGWPLAVDETGDLAGIYFNRNSLGPVGLLAAVTSVVLGAELWKRRRSRSLALGFAVVAAVDGVVWWRSGSLTPVLAAAFATGVGVLLWWAGARFRFADRVTATAVAVGIGLVTVGLVVAERTAGLETLGRSSTFSGRTVIWEYVLGLVRERPVQGWGFMAVWLHPEIIDGMYGRVAIVHEAHSGYLEVLLGAGVIGLVALLGAMSVALARTASGVLRHSDLMSFWSFWLVAYVVAVNLGETYVGANLLPWVVITVATGQAVAVAQR